MIKALISMLVIAVFCFSPHGAQAFPAIVYSVHDGDTVTLLAHGEKIHCRLAGIDAPEMHVTGKWADQPFAFQSHATLLSMIMGQTVDVQDTGQRSYRRMVCRITTSIDGRVVDVQEQMVAEGMAWSAIQFEPVRERDGALPTLEAAAHAAGRGIWALPASDQVPPWEWRHEY